jgi:bilin biosynthesis protein
MSMTSNDSTGSVQDPLQLAHDRTDALLADVNDRITLDTFDPDDAEILVRLVESLGDTRGLTRLRCAEVLAQIGEPATPFLLDALGRHANVVVRRAAAKTLTLIADPVAVPNLLHAFLNDEDTVVQGSSVGAMARIGEPAALSLLAVLADSQLSESTKGHAAWALAFMGAEAKEYLAKALESDSVDVRCAVVGAMGKVAQEEPKPELFEILVKSLHDRSVDVRSEAAAVLGNLAYQPAIPTLIELLHQHQDPESRKSAALSLMKIGMNAPAHVTTQTAVTALETALTQEPNPANQPIIKLALSQIQAALEREHA